MKNMIKPIRRYMGITQTELGNLVKVSRITIRNIESGIQKPNVYLAINIARALNLSVEELFPCPKN